MHAGPQHQALLPAAETPRPWSTVVAATYANLRDVPVLYSRSGMGDKGQWVSPGKAVVVEEVEQDGGGGAEEERVEYAKRLTKVLYSNVQQVQEGKTILLLYTLRYILKKNGVVLPDSLYSLQQQCALFVTPQYTYTIYCCILFFGFLLFFFVCFLW